MNKTVYVLGAGFSMDAGAPSQEKIIQKIFELHATQKDIFDLGKVEEFQRFLSESLLIPIDLHHKIPLEDVFTPLDKCLLENLAFRNLDINGVKRIRETIYYLIGKVLQHILRNFDKRYVDKFANYLIENCRKRKDKKYREVDSVSVLTSNWDILLDTSIQNIIDTSKELAVVDYCCHISSFREEDERVKPGLEILGLGGYNVKLLKLHGSLNWLQCPKCQRVYVDLDDKIVVHQYQNREKCRHCNKNYGQHDSHELTSNIIMPTFLKNLTNPQYKLIWQNAGIELSEAQKIVFIGYSLPQADFEMRQLLSRMIRPNVEVEVVSFSKDPSNDEDFKKLEERYKIFFGERLKLPIYHCGTRRYVEEHF